MNCLNLYRQHVQDAVEQDWPTRDAVLRECQIAGVHRFIAALLQITEARVSKYRVLEYSHNQEPVYGGAHRSDATAVSGVIHNLFSRVGAACRRARLSAD